MKILVTGAAGFIGFHLVKKLLTEGHRVVGLDNINDYYDVGLKFGRLQELGINQQEIEPDTLIQSTKSDGFSFIKANLEDGDILSKLFNESHFDVVCHLAAQAGVRYSIENPLAYINSNVVGFTNILECCKSYPVKHLVYASSSSVYGLNAQIPFATDQHTDHPVSLYAATKKSNELLAHVYSHLYKIPTTGLRFFTVYGPWGRPDMAYFSFTNAILDGKPIKVFNGGEMRRDFTYVDDVVEGVAKVLFQPASSDPGWMDTNPSPDSSKAPYRIYNIGNHKPVNLLYFINLLEKELGVEAEKQMMPMQPGDVHVTYADVSALENDFHYHPSTLIEDGIRQFVAWYKEYYKVPVKFQ
ncbi:NAD-dependent epimerase [Chitinophagaceae bacterium LB-8]|uniref:NAD-dependent epimerase n=1 Tax=Paraflavisolibacter caeni TaxID=2982496 RepID=A0A9X2XNF4_9BACT|nr:NAD-dependent epimerase [Paraflavisolibacter caeni]MCU7548069.1 NAD-dependent epimerase [Paraflavisolibacter caeni]